MQTKKSIICINMDELTSEAKSTLLVESAKSNKPPQETLLALFNTLTKKQKGTAHHAKK